MKSLKVNRYGDLVFTDGKLTFIDGYEAMAQDIFITLSTNKGEWFLNINHGLHYPTFEGKKFDKRDMIAELEETIMQVETVNQVFIDDISIDHSKRHLQIHGYATDKDGNELDLTTLEVIKW